jgi:hypothetical protein
LCDIRAEPGRQQHRNGPGHGTLCRLSARRRKL